ncbi:MAG: hypothetical protein VYB22_07760, partial [Pseudomonadota bacterium]|nr:hypothetical protein [Pseudomonadota bacterium]
LSAGALNTAAASGSGQDNATNGSYIFTTLSVTAGDTISFNWAFDADDYLSFNDFSFVVIDGVVYELADISTVGSYNSTGWESFNIVAPATGNIQIGFGVMNTGDSVGDSYLFVDNLQVNGALVQGFESGDFTGWTTAGSVSVVTENATSVNGNDADVGGSLTDDETGASIAGSLHNLVSVGADAPATFSLIEDTATLNALLPGLYSKGESVTYSVAFIADTDGDGLQESVLTAMAGDRVVFTLTVNSNGDWKFDLDDQLDHEAGDGENFALLTGNGGYDLDTVGSIDFTQILQVTDADGDQLVWTEDDINVFAIEVQDDVPTVVSAGGEFHPITARVAEDALSTAVEATDSSEGILDAGQDNSDDEASGVAGDLSSLIV